MKRRLRSSGLVILALALLALFHSPVAAAADDPSEKAFAAASSSPQSAGVADRQYLVEKDKPWYKSRKAKVIGGSTAGGALLGGLIGGGKGAVIGALAGAGGGYVVEKKTRKKNKEQ